MVVVLFLVLLLEVVLLKIVPSAQDLEGSACVGIQLTLNAGIIAALKIGLGIGTNL